VDRAYRSDGSLVPRTEPDALLMDVGVIADRALRMVETGTVLSADGSVVTVRAESLCTHGDDRDAVAIVRAVRTRLEQAGVRVASFAHA